MIESRPSRGRRVEVDPEDGKVYAEWMRALDAARRRHPEARAWNHDRATNTWTPAGRGAKGAKSVAAWEAALSIARFTLATIGR